MEGSAVGEAERRVVVVKGRTDSAPPGTHSLGSTTLMHLWVVSCTASPALQPQLLGGWAGASVEGARKFAKAGLDLRATPRLQLGWHPNPAIPAQWTGTTVYQNKRDCPCTKTNETVRRSLQAARLRVMTCRLPGTWDMRGDWSASEVPRGCCIGRLPNASWIGQLAEHVVRLNVSWLECTGGCARGSVGEESSTQWRLQAHRRPCQGEGHRRHRNLCMGRPEG